MNFQFLQDQWSELLTEDVSHWMSSTLQFDIFLETQSPLIKTSPAFAEPGTQYQMIPGTPASEPLDGTSGDDEFTPVSGADEINGFGGFDILDYSTNLWGISVSLDSPESSMTIYDDDMGSTAGPGTFINIEKIIGGSGDDSLFISSSSSFAGDFEFDGGPGADSMGISSLNANIANLTLIGGDGNDFMRGGVGQDSFDGGNDIDHVSTFNSVFGLSRQSMVVDLRIDEISNDGFGNTETIANVETVTGGSYLVDTFHGNDLDNTLVSTFSGADDLFGHGGDDLLGITDAGGTIDGGAGIDSLGFQSLRFLNQNLNGFHVREDRTDGVSVNLSTGQILSDGFGGSGTLSNIENLFGTLFADILIGDANANELSGSWGNDTLEGGAGNDILDGSNGIDTISGGADNDIILPGFKADIVDGGDGIDTVDYSLSDYFQTINLTSNVNINGHANGDVLTGIENVLGSNTRKDDITGNLLDNVLDGQGGNDILRAGKGNDTLIGGVGDDVLFGGKGADVHDGGDGRDWAKYNGSSAFVEVDLVNGGTAGIALGDTFTSIENVRGTNFDDTIKGNSDINKVIAGKGNDIIEGRGGNDALQGNDGNDTIDGGAGNDGLRGGAGNDSFVFNPGSGKDWIIDFTQGQDMIEINGSAFVDFDDIMNSAVDSGDNIFITISTGNVIKVKNMNINDFVSTDFLLDGLPAAELPPTPKIVTAEVSQDIPLLNQDLIATFMADTAVNASVVFTGEHGFAEIMTDDDIAYDWDGFAVM